MSDEASLEKPSSTLKKGLLWTQRDKLFSRWKERYFVLTKDYINCFKKGSSRISEMGEFLYKVKICDTTDLELLDKRGYLTICLCLPKDGKIYLRKTEGIRDWHRLLKECQQESRQKRRENGEEGGDNLDTESFWARKQVTDSSSIENWLQKRKKNGLLSNYSDSTPDINKASSASSTPAKPSRPEITLTELSALYRHANEADDVARPDRPASMLPALHPAQQPALLLPSPARRGAAAEESVESSSMDKVVVRMRRSKEDVSPSKRKPKIINRLSLMSDIELPDFGNHHNVELEKGIFLKRTKNLLDAQSNDSGNHSMSTNASLSSSSSSKSKDSNEDREQHPEVLHRTVVQVRHRERSYQDGDRHRESSAGEKQRHRRSAYAHGLQITHV